jgi:hypothetical protein
MRPSDMGQTIALIWLAVALGWAILWAATDLNHNRRYGNWDFGHMFSRLPTVALVALSWPVLLPVAFFERLAKRKR